MTFVFLETFTKLHKATVSFVASVRRSVRVQQRATHWTDFYETENMRRENSNFDVLLTVLLSTFILAINQLDAQNLCYNKFISCLYMLRAPCAHRQEVKIVLYSH